MELLVLFIQEHLESLSSSQSSEKNILIMESLSVCVCVGMLEKLRVVF